MIGAILGDIIGSRYEFNNTLKYNSSNLAAMANGKPVLMVKYESRFRQSLLPDTVHLKAENYDLQIPAKWKSLQTGTIA